MPHLNCPEKRISAEGITRCSCLPASDQLSRVTAPQSLAGREGNQYFPVLEKKTIQEKILTGSHRAIIKGVFDCQQVIPDLMNWEKKKYVLLMSCKLIVTEFLGMSEILPS